MSRFVPEGKSDLKSLQAKEKEAYKKFKDEQEDKEHLSLYDQMKLNYLAKEQAYEDKVKAKNQASQLTERELEFYNKLEREKELKELSKKREIEAGLSNYEDLKRQRLSAQKKRTTTTQEPNEVELPQKIQFIKKGIRKSKKLGKKTAEVAQKPDTKEDITTTSEKLSIVTGYDSDSE